VKIYAQKFIISTLCCLTLCCGCQASYGNPERTEVTQGVLDLSSWDFRSEGAVSPKGDWEFFWKKFFNIKTKEEILASQPDGYLPIPGNWKRVKTNQKIGVTPLGFMTIHLRIKNKDYPETPHLSIYIPQIRSAFELFVHKPGKSPRLAAKSGIIGKTKDTHRAWFAGATANFEASGMTDIILNISNFEDLNNQGIYEDLFIGTTDQIVKIKNDRRQRDFFIMGMIFFAGIFMLILYALRRSELAPLWLGLFSLTFAFRAVVIRLYLYELIDDLNWFDTLFRLNYFTVYFPVIAYIAFLRNIFPKYFSQRFSFVAYGISLLYMLVTLMTSPAVYSRFLIPFFVFILICFVWMAQGQIKALLHRKDIMSFMALLGAAFIIFFGGADILSRLNLIEIQNNLQIGLSLNILCMAVIVSVQNVRERNRVERMSNQLSQEISIRENAEKEISLLNRQLAERVDETTVKLKTAQKELEQKEHKTEIAEITTGTLHNVKNVLNNLKTSAELLKESKDGHFVEGFKKASQMLRQNFETIEDFMTRGDTGRKLLDYYLKLDELLDKETDESTDLINRILERIRAIEEIIDSQQRYGVTAKTENISPAVVLEDALNMQMGSISRKRIRITKQFDSKATIKVEKIKLLHVLINLTKNATEAMVGNPKDSRILDLQIKEKNRILEIRVRDNGHGIDPENKDKLFSRGFTTKEEGHGFGLNSSLNYINEMGGELKFESGGAGKGATFIVQFPVSD